MTEERHHSIHENTPATQHQIHNKAIVLASEIHILNTDIEHISAVE